MRSAEYGVRSKDSASLFHIPHSVFHTRTVHILIAFFIGILLTGVLVLFFRFDLLEIVTYDLRFIWRPNQDFSANIVCVAIDEDSFSAFKGIDPRMATWPWSPEVFGQVIDNLAKWGARVIAIDKLFSEPDIRPPPEPGKTAEEVLTEAMRRHGRIVLACKQENRIFQDDPGKPAVNIKTFTGPSGETGILLKAARLGSINVPQDRDQGVRWVSLEFHHGDKRIPSFARAIVESFWDLPAEQSKRVSDRRFRIGDRLIPLGDPGYMAINFTGKRVPMVSLAYVWDGDLSFFGYEPEIFRDAIVLIGAWTTDMHDLFRVPHSRAEGFSARHTIPGVEIQAQAVNTILSGDFLQPLSQSTRILISLACGLFVTICCSMMGVQMGIVTFLLAMLAYAGVSVWVFSARNLILPIAHPILTMFLTGAGVTSYRYVREAIEKRFLKDIFSKTTDENLVNLIIENPDLVTLGGEEREATILFSDIRSYSTLSEGMNPKDLIDLLNEYFAAWTDVIFRHRGMVDKFIGDAVMAVFGAPIANDTHPEDACRAAIELIEKLEKLSDKWKSEGRRVFRIGIGIHTGRFVFGTVGSEQRFSYTCVGDVVNIASRIEGLNKEHGTTVLISEDTYDSVSDLVVAESKGRNEIRGRVGTVELFELVGLKDGRPSSGSPGSQEDTSHSGQKGEQP